MSAPASAEDGWKSMIKETASRVQNHEPLPPRVQNVPKAAFVKSVLPGLIDHTLLKTDATVEQIESLCDEAKRYNFRTVCVRLPWVKLAVKALQGSSVGVACVIGFPEGSHPTSDKVKEASEAVQSSVTELDMVLNYEWLKAGKYHNVFNDIHAVREVAEHEAKLKVILETSQLSYDQIIAGSLIACLAGADYVKTSTGFKGSGATAENVDFMRKVCEVVAQETGVEQAMVKASGGIRTVDDAFTMWRAGADRIGASAGVSMIQEWENHGGEEGPTGPTVGADY